MLLELRLEPSAMKASSRSIGQPIEAHMTRGVHARLVVDAVLAQRLVLDEVERRLAPEQGEELVLQRVAEDAAEIPDRL